MSNENSSKIDTIGKEKNRVYFTELDPLFRVVNHTNEGKPARAVPNSTDISGVISNQPA